MCYPIIQIFRAFKTFLRQLPEKYLCKLGKMTIGQAKLKMTLWNAEAETTSSSEAYQAVQEILSEVRGLPFKS